MAYNLKNRLTGVVKDVGKLEPSHTVYEIVKWFSQFGKNSLEDSLRLKKKFTTWPNNSFLSIYPKEMKLMSMQLFTCEYL